MLEGENMKLKVMALVVMLGIVGRVDADMYFRTGGQLLSDCESDQAGFQGGCITYLGGISDATVGAPPFNGGSTH
jgi:hypothetical protein